MKLNIGRGGLAALVVEARIADYLRNEHKELKHIYVAEAVGIKQSRFSDILNGRAELKADEFMKICSFLGEEPSRFIKPMKKIE